MAHLAASVPYSNSCRVADEPPPLYSEYSHVMAIQKILN